MEIEHLNPATRNMGFRMDNVVPPANMGVGRMKHSKKLQNGNSQVEPTMRMFKSCSTNLHCAVCFGQNGRVCQGCHNIAYCSRDHQIQHWGIHQKNCKPLVSVQKSEVLRNLSLPVEERNFDPYTGMYRAKRNMKPTDNVLHITPIMHVAHNKGIPVPPDSILCLGCNRWYQLSQGYRCTKCKWPVCSERCENNSCHAKFECRIFCENKIYPPHTAELYNGDAILALRCLMLKEVKPEDWEQLVEMEPVVEKVIRPQHYLESDEKIARFLYFNCHFSDYPGTTYQSIMRLLKIIDFCSIWLPERSAFLWDKQFSFVSAKYVFPAKVFIAEACSANLNWSLRHSPELSECSIRLRASVVIREGEYLTACFSGIAEYGASFPKRYENCRFMFRCKCRRCVDPTEGGSFFSGVRCSSCDNTERGYLLPEDPSDHDGKWRCYNEACGKLENGAKISTEINKIHQDIQSSTNSFQALLTLMKNYEGVRLHPNHYLIMKATQLCIDLCWGICQNSALHLISLSLLDKAKTLTEKLANIYKSIYPWKSIQNAKLLFHYQMLHGVARVRELLSLDRKNVDDKLLWPNEFWDIMKIQKSAVDVLIEEPLGSVERENAILMKGVLEDTESLLVMEMRNSRIQYETLLGLQKVYARYCSAYLYSVIPINEDKELHELVLFTGPYCKDLADKGHFVV